MAATRRYEAAGWLRRMVGVVGARDLPEEPTEEEFRLGLRNGIVLCNALNKVQPGAVPKVVEAPVDPTLLPDGAALSAYQYFENLRNFLDALEELGLPTFEASDLERMVKAESTSPSLKDESFSMSLKDGETSNTKLLKQGLPFDGDTSSTKLLKQGLLFDRQKTEIQNLSPYCPHKPLHVDTLDIRNSSQTGFAVPDANSVPVTSTTEVIELMDIGQKNRAVSSTSMNDRSSRSHSCLTIHVQGRELASGVVVRGCMHLVDLAGSERVASLKAALAKKEGEHLCSALSSPDIYGMKSGATSPAHPNHMQSMEDFGNIEVRSCSALMQERVELDLQDLLTVSDSSSWPERYPKLSKFGSKETGEDVIQNEDALSAWEGENPHVPDSFYQGYIPDVRAFRDEHTSRANSVATEDLDDLDFAMSESSEQDVLSQSSLPKSSNAVNRIKRPQSGAAKSSDVR
ncbi:hypothetical protein B296_00047849 [Ensete ventricosum]|uniref:Calponin-homology (CH) domain-containing protein n=1 Tax=Ensete ventricosum TaxID=4639 RepID=A0A426YXS0_ENSVE|nr:hypothetical protein B296_00047849 [Ensete ventricosum]